MITFAKNKYTIEYSPEELGAFGPPPPDDDHIEEVLRRGLLDRVGLDRRDDAEGRDGGKNRDLLDDD